LWKLRPGEVATLEPAAYEIVESLAFSPDNPVGRDRPDVLRVWELRRIREQLARLKLDWPSSALDKKSAVDFAKPLQVTDCR
jgi:hypothetical protein